MQSLSNRSVIVISGLLTLLVLGGGMLTLALHNGWLQVAPAAAPGQAQQDESSPALARAESRGRVDQLTDTAQSEVAAYRGKLEDAYRSLDEAYAQVRVLQSAQAQVRSRQGREHESDAHHESRRERHERESRGEGDGDRAERGHDRQSGLWDADND